MIMSDDLLKIKDWRAKFNIRVKAPTNATKGFAWIELGNKSDNFDEIVSQLNALIDKWGIHIEKIETAREVPVEYFYQCLDCKNEVPAEESMPIKERMYCNNCKNWTTWHKVIR